MQINAIRASTQSDSTSGGDAISGSNDMFLQLLVAQLKTQDPLSPMDPNQMVDQLVQLNTLTEVSSIHQLLQDMYSSTGGDANKQGG